MDISVFYDRAEEASLWGKDLYVYLDDIYRNRSRLCVLFISQHYKEKRWTNHELRSAFSRALNDFGQEYILPARFDQTELRGLQPTIGYIDLTKRTPNDLGLLIAQKLGRTLYLLPALNTLNQWYGFDAVQIRADKFVFTNSIGKEIAEYPIQTLVGMYKLGLLEEMFLMTETVLVE